MFRAVWNSIVFVITAPARVWCWAVEGIVAFRQFLDERRRHLCIAILTAMMVVVGVKLRHPGFADEDPAGYLAVSFGNSDDSETGGESGIANAIAASLNRLASSLPSLTGDDPELHNEPAEPARTTEVRSVPVLTATSRTEKPPVLQTRRRLILPEPTVVDLAEIDGPETAVASEVATEEPSATDVPIELIPEDQRPPAVPQVAKLAGTIEVDDDEPAK